MTDRDDRAYDEFLPRVQSVIVSATPIGSGKDDNDPVRRLIQVHTLDGELIADYDPFLRSDNEDSDGA